MATHEEALTAKKALNKEAFNGRVLTVKWCALAPACTEVAPRLVMAKRHRSTACSDCTVVWRAGLRTSACSGSATSGQGSRTRCVPQAQAYDVWAECLGCSKSVLWQAST